MIVYPVFQVSPPAFSKVVDMVRLDPHHRAVCKMYSMCRAICLYVACALQVGVSQKREFFVVGTFRRDPARYGCHGQNILDSPG